MAKLIKLTTKSDTLNKTNSFRCQSDEDIYIEPNSTVSLLNAHISSGILSSYNVDGNDVAGLDVGLHVASLYLTENQTDRERKIIVQNGNYDITTVCAELTNACNKSLLFNSTTTPVSSTADVFKTPSNNDFGLGMLVNLNESSKVSIKFNSVQQKATDLNFSNKNDGVNVDPANGNITFTNPTGLVNTGLISQQADDVNKIVYSTSDVTGNFAIGDAVQIVSSADGSSNVVYITDIQPSVNSLTNAVGVSAISATSIQFNDVVTSTVPLDPSYSVGKIVSMDDGTSVANPLNNGAHGTINSIELPYVNPNLEITEVSDFRGLHPISIDVDNASFVDPNDQNLGVNLLFSNIQLVDAEDYGFVDDRFVSIWKTPNYGDLYCVATITNVQADNTGTGNGIIVTVYPLANSLGKNININVKNCNHVKVFDIFDTNLDGGYDIEKIPTIDGSLPSAGGDFNGTLITVLYDKLPLFQCVVQDITNIANTAFGNRIKLQINEYTALNDAGTLISDINAYYKFVSIFNNLDDIKIRDISTIFVDKFVSSKPVASNTIPFLDLDPLVIDELNGNSFEGIIMNGNLFDYVLTDGSSYTVIPIDFTEVDEVRYNFINAVFIELRDTTEAPYLVKTNTDKNVILNLTNLDVPDLTALPISRLWLGYDIYVSNEITLNVQALRRSLKDYDLMIKGTLTKGQPQSYALQDNRLSRSCGRAVIRIQNVGACEFGIMPETSDFLNQSITNNYVRVKIQNNPGGGFIYTLWQGTRRFRLKTNLEALSGDRVCIQWGVCPSTTDFEYNNNINGGTNPAAINNASFTASAGVVTDSDRQKMLFSVVRNGELNNYFYLGSIQTGGDFAKVIPWTPRASPYLEPIYFDNTGNYRIYCCPNQATLRLIEITIDPTIVTVDGVTKYLTEDTVIYDSSIHSQDHPDLVEGSHRLNSFSNSWLWLWRDLYFQKQLGFKSPRQYVSAASGSFVATADYLTAYLPENLVVFLDNVACSSYDLEKVKGLRRNIIGTAISTNGKIGEVNVEPSNLYKIALNNKERINIRKFSVSFETFYGEEVILMSARAVVNLLFEQSK